MRPHAAGHGEPALRLRSENAVCNAQHNATRRLCRWLLSSADRGGARELNLTQSPFARMLGVRRRTVGEIAVDLQSTGLIRYRRGDIQITDRHAPESLGR